MIRYFKTKAIWFLCLALPFMAGCSSDEPINVKGDGTTSLKIVIPSTTLSRSGAMTRGGEIATRAHTSTAALKEGEGAVHKLYVIGFYDYDGTNARKHFIEEVNPEAGVAIDGVYRSFSFNVEPSTYNLYLIGNMDMSNEMLSALKGSGNSSALETQVKDLQHSYSSGLPDLVKGLPMTGVKSNLSVARGLITEAKVDLAFLCAKVRLTIFHEEELGRPGMKVTQVNATNLYQPVNLFAAGTKPEYGTNYSVTDEATAFSAHYPIAALSGKDIEELKNRPTDATDPIENLGEALTDAEIATSLANVYQGVVYVPESKVLSDLSQATTVHAQMSDGTDSKTFHFPVGCTDNDTDHSANVAGNQVKRGQFYDIIAKIRGGEIEYSWNVKAWDIENLAIELAGTSELYVGTTVIDKIDGSEPIYIPYSTDAQALTFESSTTTVGGRTVPVFTLKEKKSTGMIEVSINTGIGFSSIILENQYFWVNAGSIRKRVDVKKVDSKAFVRITPAERNLQIANIVNSQSYPLWFEYSTNMDNLKITLSDYVNSNTSKKMRIRVYTGSEEEPEEYSVESSLSDGLDISALGKAAGVTEDFPKTGLICITVIEPAEKAAYGKKISGTIKAVGSSSGTSSVSNEGKFTINPSPDKYTIHFKAIGENWTNPHCYVYQPLMYNDYYVFDTNEGLNWLEYSFTGKVVFKGWKSMLGEIDDPAPSQLKSVTQGGDTFNAYRLWNADGKNISTDQYYTNIDLISDFRVKLKQAGISCGCQDGNSLQTWPGVAMIKEGDWWTVELPLFAEPGKALVMFANAHNNDNSAVYRYPADKMPGIPLPNFASGEAWFLYDKNKVDQVAFSDTERDSY